ncbi:AMP-binding protein [Pseudomonas lactis]|uniref:AMP-binding protein n=1 Tax=Pseudomonas lactis TaxID=1615674 RepID=A0A7Y1M797_9PSED|nr:AMP-binding protein [Pseudomonas lactis]NNA76495.1 AMP-binding protein [Pseudomonas lactis]
MSETLIAPPVKHLLNHAKQTPDVPYLVKLSNGNVTRKYTWRAVVDEVRRCAAYLHSLNLPEKSCIAIWAKNSPHWVISDLAIWMAGHISVPLYPTLSADLAKYTLEHCSAELLFIGDTVDWEKNKTALPSTLRLVALPEGPATAGVVTWEQVQLNPVLPEDKFATVQPDDIATIIYTSGTTGLPKGVVHTFASVDFSVTHLSQLTAVKFADRVISYLPMSHVGERLIIELQSIYVGMEVFFNESQETFIADMRVCNPSIFLAVPRIWTKLRLGMLAMLPAEIKAKIQNRSLSPEEGKRLLSAIGLGEAAFGGCAAAPVSTEILDWYAGLGLYMLEAYGMTENFGYSHMGPISGGRSGFVGPANPGVKAKLSAEGEILVKSEATMQGYYLDDEQTASSFDEDGYYKTGDRGVIDADGWLRVVGRVKDIFKTSKGKYVAPSPIENTFADIPFVDQVCVMGSGRPQPLALVTLSEIGQLQGQDQLSAHLQNFLTALNAKLEPHEKLSCIVALKDQWSIDNGLITPTLKIKRNVLESHYASLLNDINETFSGVLLH